MRRLLPLLLALLLTSSCAGFPYAAPVRPVDLYGTVTLIDSVKHRIDLELDYVTRYTLQLEETSRGLDQLRRNERPVPLYYDEDATVWNGVRYDEIHAGDRLVVSSRFDNGHWRAYAVSSRTN